MSRRPSDIDARLAAWLDDGPSHGPEEVLSRALAQARSTRQDRVWLDRFPLSTRFQHMNTMIRFAAVAVLALAVGVYIVPRAQEIAAPAEPPTPLRQGVLPAGDYTVAPFHGPGTDFWACAPNEPTCPEAARDDAIRFTFTVPDGWSGAPFGSDIWLTDEHNSGPDGAGMLLGRGGWIYSDGCKASQGPPDVPVGPTVDDFVEAVASYSSLDVSEPVDVEVGGHPAKYLSVTTPADVAACPNFQIWDPTAYAQGASNLWHIWVVDVDGVRIVVHGSEFPETSPQRSAELRAIVDSLRIERDPAMEPSVAPSGG